MPTFDLAKAPTRVRSDVYLQVLKRVATQTDEQDTQVGDE